MRSFWNFRLIENWRWVLRYAWSVRVLVLAALLAGVEVALPFVDALLPFGARGLAAIYFSVTVLALIFRFKAQSRLEKEV